MLKKVIHYAHELLKESVRQGETVIDATCGNGHDTLLLCQLVGEHGKVLAFDVQKQAIENTKLRLNEYQYNHVEVIQDSHANVGNYLSPTEKGKIGGTIFNLGYLPRSDKTVITEGDSTIKAIQAILPYLKKNGLIVLVIYHGYPGGKEEKETVLDYVQALDQTYYDVLQYAFINQRNNPPFVIAIQNKQKSPSS